MIQAAKIGVGAIVAVAIAVGAGFELSTLQATSGSSSSSSFIATTVTTTVSNGSVTHTATSTGSCGIILGTGGPVFLKVESDQGFVITNGSVDAVHMGPVVNDVYCGTSNYRVFLRPQTNGYTIVSANDSLGLAGSYNFTLVAGYGGNKTFNTTISNVVIRPTTPVYVTVMVPSGTIITSNCLQGDCTTTTLRTSSSG